MTPDEILREWNEKNNAKVKTTVTEIAHKDAGAENAQLIEDASKKEMENDMPNRINENETPEQRRIRELEEMLAQRDNQIAQLIAQRAQTPQQNNHDAIAGGGLSYFDRYVDKECKSEEEKDALKEDVGSFWARLTGYQNADDGQRAYGLAVGKVQSGKTRNYIGLMFKAIDDGYNTIIILTSKNSRLAYQMHKRVFGWLNGANGLGMNNYHELTRLSEGQNGAQGVEWIGSNNFNPKRVYIGVVLKNEAGHLAQVRDWLTRIRDSVQNMRMLLVDDESDSATPNTNNAGEPYIESLADIDKYIDDLQNQDVMAQLRLRQWSDEKSSAVANWLEEMKNLSQQEIDNGRVKVVTDILHDNPTRAAFRTAIRENNQFQRAIGIDQALNISDQNWNLYALVDECFSNEARGRKTVNWRVLRDLLYFVFSVQQERSRINRSICEIVGKSNEYTAIFNYEKMVYVAYTATPYANMYQEGGQKNPLYPDCIKTLKTSSKYFGLQRIFGRDGFDCNMNIVRAIDDEEYRGWVQIVQEGEEIGWYTSELVSDNGVEWCSLKKAIQWAFCSAAARRIKRLSRQNVDDWDSDIKDRWTTMLFNLSHLSSQENGAHRVQQQIVKDYVNEVTLQENREYFLEECRKLWVEETNAFPRDAFGRACQGYGDVPEYPSVDDVVRPTR